MALHPLAAQGFADVADLYDRGRPDYPEEVVPLLGLQAGARVLDLAAGTGKLTRLFRAAGFEVVPVEPLPAMRARIEGALEGTAEAIPVEDASVDAVTVGDAWHWFDADRAAAELARVVRPGGVVAILWQGPSGEDTPAWAQATGAVLNRIRPAHPGFLMKGPPDLRPAFGEAEHRTLPFTYETDRERYVAFVSSMSYVSTLPPEQKSAVLREIEALVPDGPLGVPYATQAFLSRRRPG